MNNLFKVNVIPFNIRNTISFVLLIASFILLYFGVTEPMMKISAEYAGQEVFKYKQSILEAVDTLYEGGYLLVSFLSHQSYQFSHSVRSHSTYWCPFHKGGYV